MRISRRRGHLVEVVGHDRVLVEERVERLDPPARTTASGGSVGGGSRCTGRPRRRPPRETGEPSRSHRRSCRVGLEVTSVARLVEEGREVADGRCSSPAASSSRSIAGYPVYRHWNRLTRWHSLDGYAYGLAIGLGLGRIGCYAVGEHFGSSRSFPLVVRYDGGRVREELPGSVPLQEGMVFDQTAPDELMYMLVLFVILSIVLYVRKLSARAWCRDGRLQPWFYGVAPLPVRPACVSTTRPCSASPGRSTCAWPCCPPASWIWFRVRKQLLPAGRSGRHAGGHDADLVGRGAGSDRGRPG